MSLARAATRALLGGLFVAVSAGWANNLLFNGGFDTGDLNGWTPFTTANGTLGVSMPTVVPFLTDGVNSSNAVRFQVGEAGEDHFSFGGGGISQTVTVPTGQVSFLVDIAAQGGLGANMYGGFVQVLLDTKPVLGYDFGALNAGEIKYTTLDFSFVGDSAPHTIALQFLRPALADSGTPYQYASNLRLYAGGESGAFLEEVPEPSSWLLFSFGLAVLCALRGRIRFGRRTPARL
jgi:hypothetical protein